MNLIHLNTTMVLKICPDVDCEMRTIRIEASYHETKPYDKWDMQCNKGETRVFWYAPRQGQSNRLENPCNRNSLPIWSSDTTHPVKINEYMTVNIHVQRAGVVSGRDKDCSPNPLQKRASLAARRIRAPRIRSVPILPAGIDSTIVELYELNKEASKSQWERFQYSMLMACIYLQWRVE